VSSSSPAEGGAASSVARVLGAAVVPKVTPDTSAAAAGDTSARVLDASLLAARTPPRPPQRRTLSTSAEATPCTSAAGAGAPVRVPALV
jgi:hypothetical protein